MERVKDLTIFKSWEDQAALYCFLNNDAQDMLSGN